MTRTFDPVFSAALREHLAATVRNTSKGSWLRRHLPLTIGGILGLTLLGTAGTAAAEAWLMPGSQQISPLGSMISASGTGTTPVPLGAAPAGATNIELQFTCDTAATYRFADGSSFTCTTSDLGQTSSQIGIDLPVVKGTTSTTIETSHNGQWTLQAQYTNELTTTLSVNNTGQTYGADNPVQHPDLLAVTATNGRSGYAYQKDLAWAENGDHPAPTSPAQAIHDTRENAGKIFHVPVYLSDGKTRIGTFDVGQ